MASSTQVLNELNTAVSNLNAKTFKLSNYLDDWASLPTAVKTAVKSNVTTYLTQLKSDIDTFITDVNSL